MVESNMLLLFILAVLVLLTVLVVKTGGFFLDGLANLFNRLLQNDFSNFTAGDIAFIILLTFITILCIKYLTRLTKRYK